MEVPTSLIAGVAHMNVARLSHPPGDPRVVGFVDNVPKVNAIAERSAGYIWRHVDKSAAVGDGIQFQTLNDDPCLAISLSVWASLADLQHFVYKTVHGGFFRRRTEWFAPWDGPKYAIWNHPAGDPPTLEEGWKRLRHLAEKRTLKLRL